MSDQENRSKPPRLLPLLAGAAAAVVSALALDAFWIEPQRVVVEELDLPVPGLPDAWTGARLVHLSDLHYGDPRSDQLLSWMVRRVNGLEPDLIAITGDFVMRFPREVPPMIRYVERLRARYGVLAVLGDHDYVPGTRRVIPGVVEALESAGIGLLRNRGVELPGGLRVAGTDPRSTKVDTADLPAALRDCPDPHLFLTHSPDLLPELSHCGVRLALCGHTHGGQVVVPFYGPPITHTRVGRRHAAGWSERGRTRLYTSRGLASHYSLRFNCPPEVTVFRMVRADG
ncbi:MAG: metallophosphoesterase [Armatimonadota bacterium]